MSRRIKRTIECLEARYCLSAFGFVEHTIEAIPSGTSAAMVGADLDGDGFLDLITKNVWRRNDGSGNFGPDRKLKAFR